MQRFARGARLEELGHRFGKLLDFAPIHGFDHRLSAREMTIQRADTDTGAARDFFQAYIQPGVGESCLGGINEKLPIPGAVGARFADIEGRRTRVGSWL